MNSIVKILVLLLGSFLIHHQMQAQVNVAVNKRASQSSLYTSNAGSPSNAVDGKTDGRWQSGSVTHTNGQGENNPWWTVDLGEVYEISKIRIWNRTDCCAERLDNFKILVKNQPSGESWRGFVSGTQRNTGSNQLTFEGNAQGRYVMIQLVNPKGILSLAEVEVYGATIQGNQPIDQPIVDAAIQWNAQKSYFFQGDHYGRYDLKGTSYDTGFPKKISEGGWNLPAGWNNVDAAINWGNSIAYLFRGNQYVRYNMNTSKVEGGAKDTQSNWELPSNWNGKVDAAINWGNSIAYLFSGNQYMRYNINTGKAEGGAKDTQSNWNLPASWNGKVDAAINWQDGNAFLFHGSEYVRFPINGSEPSTSAKSIASEWQIKAISSRSIAQAMPDKGSYRLDEDNLNALINKGVNFETTELEVGTAVRYNLSHGPTSFIGNIANHIQGMTVFNDGKLFAVSYSQWWGAPENTDWTGKNSLVIIAGNGIYKENPVPASPTEASGLQACGDILAVAWATETWFYKVDLSNGTMDHLDHLKIDSTIHNAGGGFVGFTRHKGIYYTAIADYRTNTVKLYNYSKSNIEDTNGKWVSREIEFPKNYTFKKPRITGATSLVSSGSNLYIINMEYGDQDDLDNENEFVRIFKCDPLLSQNRVTVENIADISLPKSVRMSGEPFFLWAGTAHVDKNGRLSIYSCGKVFQELPNSKLRVIRYTAK